MVLNTGDVSASPSTPEEKLAHPTCFPNKPIGSALFEQHPKWPGNSECLLLLSSRVFFILRISSLFSLKLTPGGTRVKMEYPLKVAFHCLSWSLCREERVIPLQGYWNEYVFCSLAFLNKWFIVQNKSTSNLAKYIFVFENVYEWDVSVPKRTFR